jgi:hypothetical protein
MRPPASIGARALPEEVRCADPHASGPRHNDVAATGWRRDACGDPSRKHVPRGPSGRAKDTRAGSRQAKRATERLAFDPLAALNPSSASAHSKTLTLRSPISQFVQCPCQGLGLMPSRSRGEESVAPVDLAGTGRVTRPSPELLPAPGGARLARGSALPAAGRAQSPQGGGGERNVHPRRRRGRSGGTVRGDQSPAETSDPASLIPTHRRRTRGYGRTAPLHGGPWPLRPGNPVQRAAPNSRVAGRSRLLGRRSSTRG